MIEDVHFVLLWFKRPLASSSISWSAFSGFWSSSTMVWTTRCTSRATPAYPLLRKFGERADLRHEGIYKVTAHRIGGAAECAEGNAVVSLSVLKFLNVLPRHAHATADFCQTETERLAHSSEPST